MAETRLKSLDSMESDELLRQVQMHQFSMHDLALYLDTHPTDSEALEAFLAHREACERASALYVRRFGALRKEQTETENGWAAWSNTPWPWEKEAN